MSVEFQKQLNSILKQEDIDSAKQKAEEFVKRIETKEDPNYNTFVNELGNLGDREQRSAGESLNGLNTPVHKLMKNGNSDIPKKLLELRECVSDLNPKQLSTGGVKSFFNKILRINPLEKYMTKYQTVDKNIQEIVKSLLHGQDQLQKDNVNLEMTKSDSIEKIYELEKQIFLGRAISDMLDEKKMDTEWTNKIHVIEEMQKIVLTRTANMSQTVLILEQNIGATDTLKKTNDDLKESIRNAITNTRNIVPIAAQIHLALQNQTNVIKAIHSVNSITEDLLVSNAKALKHNTEKTRELLEKPSISLEKLQQAFNDVYDAMIIQEESTKRIIHTNKEYIEKMAKLNDDIKQKIQR